MKEKIYQNMVAGRIAVVKGKAEKSVQYTAASALQAERIHVVISERDGFAYYLAVASSILASEPNFKSELAAALPTHENHRGDGIYVCYANGVGTAIVFSGERFEYYFSESEAIADLIETEGLSVFDVSAAVGWALTSAVGRNESAGQQFGFLLARFAVGWLFVLVIILVGLHVASYFTKALSSAEITAAYAVATKQIETTQPLANDLANIEKVSNVAIKSGGWIEKFELKDGGDPSYRLSLPQWVSKDYVDALGAGVKTEFDRVSDRVVATRVGTTNFKSKVESKK